MDEFAIKPTDMGLVEPIVGSRERIPLLPEFLRLGMAVDAVAHYVALSDVERGQVLITFFVGTRM